MRYIGEKKELFFLLGALFFLVAIPTFFAQAEEMDNHGIQASFNLKYDEGTATVSIHPSVQSTVSRRVDYRIKLVKKGKAGISTQKNGGRLELEAGKMTDIGPLLSFRSFAASDTLQLELRICKQGTRCKKDGSVLAAFTTSYPDESDTGD